MLICSFNLLMHFLRDLGQVSTLFLQKLFAITESNDHHCVIRNKHSLVTLSKMHLHYKYQVLFTEKQVNTVLSKPGMGKPISQAFNVYCTSDVLSG